jgi:DNA integrity scanning protein DisA with diadenylate cyclase activity
MTRNEKLDKILLMLIAIDVKELKNEPIDMAITMDFINEALIELELVDWEMKSLKDELLNEKLVIEKNGELRITQKGKKFITRDKGFRNLEKISDQEDTIREKTIEKFRYDKFAFWFSLIAIGISLATLFFKQ